MEIDALLGAVVELAALTDKPVPLCEAIPRAGALNVPGRQDATPTKDLEMAYLSRLEVMG